MHGAELKKRAHGILQLNRCQSQNVSTVHEKGKIAYILYCVRAWKFEAATRPELPNSLSVFVEIGSAAAVRSHSVTLFFLTLDSGYQIFFSTGREFSSCTEFL